MSAKRQKLEHRNVPLSETFLTQDIPYVPPVSLRGGWWWKAEQRAEQQAEQGKRATKEEAPRIVPSPQEHDLRDPFVALGDDELFMIIALLPARDTETLRRVSKLWKTRSESLCGKSALLMHFPWAVAKADRCETREAVNLLFRRCLYYQQSLEAGLATRAIRCDGTSDWHVHENRLLWSRTEEPPLIMDLRTVDDSSITDADSIQLDISHAVPNETCRRYLQVIPGGDFLMTTLLIKDNVNQAHQVTRISAGGSVVWRLDLNATMTRPVIGKESFYLVHGPCIENDVGECKMTFAKHRLCDGSTVFDVTIPLDIQIHKKMLEFDGFLLLTGNERLVTWGSISRSDVHVFSTSTGENLSSISMPRKKKFSPLLQGITPSTRAAGLWITTQRTARFYDETSGSFSGAQRYKLGEGGTYDPPFVTFDGDLSVFLCSLYAKVGSGGGHTDNFAQIGILPTARASDSESGSSDSIVPITLPGRTKADGKRRDLELELPWNFKEGDFFGMIDHYLVYHSRKLEHLVLVDFWPVW